MKIENRIADSRLIPSDASLLVLTMLLAFCIRLYSVVKFESVIHEFDPWFNFRATEYLVQNGWKAFLEWRDEKVWHPLGRFVGITVYPGMLVTTALAHWLLNEVIAFPIDLKNICVFTGPFFSAFTALSTYHLTRELGGKSGAGLLAAAFMSIIPGYISRSVAGSFDYEAISIFQMMTTFLFWIKAVKQKSTGLALVTAGWYFYMASSWGGYVFVINLIPLHALALLLLEKGKNVDEVYRVYCPFYVCALLSAMTVPFVSHQPIDTSEHMGAMLVFAIFQVAKLYKELQKIANAQLMRKIHMLAGVAASVGAAIVSFVMRGRIAPWAGRFYSLWDTSYAKKHIPIIASVSEHQPTSWATFFLDLHLLMALAPLGLFFGIKDGWSVGNQAGAVFLALYGVTASYFAAVMVRLILTLSPIVCISAALGMSRVVASGRGLVQKLTLGVPFLGLAMMFLWHCCFVTHNAYSSPSIMLSSYTRDGQVQVIDDFREAYGWLRHNTPEDSKILAWWDYGYQLNGMTGRTTIVDNNTWNNEHIALVGRILASDERTAHRLCKELGVDYVLVLFGGISGFSGDDLNKFLWMIRIAQGVFPSEVEEAKFYNAQGEYRMDQPSESLRESVLYKMSFHGVGRLMGKQAVDRARRVAIPGVDPKLTLFAPAYSSENFILRIYKVL